MVNMLDHELQMTALDAFKTALQVMHIQKARFGVTLDKVALGDFTYSQALNSSTSKIVSLYKNTADFSFTSDHVTLEKALYQLLDMLTAKHTEKIILYSCGYRRG